MTLFPKKTNTDKRFYTATITDILAVHEDIRILVLRPDTPFTWQAGQYINISVGGLPARPYSIASAPGHSLEIHIKRGKGNASAYVMDRIQKNETVLFSEPEGRSVFNETINGPVLALAGGLGIAPIKAIAEQAFRTGFSHPFTLYWSATSESEHYIDENFKMLAREHDNFKFVPLTGRVMSAIIEKDIPHLKDWRVYLSGSPAMMAALVPVLLAKGADLENISYDRHPEAEIPAS
ncbi:MAG: hypothetical protein CO093_09450 [Alphaproteobacteria bacterium CG_4_9_14_3_um_filter_47_13]|nr:MAG: hypothetical protein CO093_09450 [Alphaproteobacteria bacterium CG_4_9_14_3_um_filter_47_13]